MIKHHIYTALLVTLAMICMTRSVMGGMLVQSYDGPVSSAELTSFLNYLPSLVPDPDNIDNGWAQHDSGEAMKAMGLVYEISQNVGILAQMVRFCDALLSQRNDLAPAPVGQNVCWTNRIDPIWPNVPANETRADGTGGEQGDPVGHLAYTARLILQSPAIWSTVVSIGDPRGYGATYLQRAKTYIQGAEVAVFGHILRSQLDMSRNNQMWFSAPNPYKGGTPVPWNQVMMFTYAFQNLATAHDILGVNQTRANYYRNIVQVNMDWFFSTGVKRITDAKGNPAYTWGYSLPSTDGEDVNHGNLDFAGLYRAYLTGEYTGITPASLTPIANTYVDIVMRGPGDYAGKFNGQDGSGNASPTNYVRSPYFSLAEFRPDAYSQMMADGRIKLGSTSNTRMDVVGRLFFCRNRRYQSYTVSAVAVSGQTNTYNVGVSAKGAWASQVTFNLTGLPAGVSPSWSNGNKVTGSGSTVLTLTASGSTPSGTYSVTVRGWAWGQVVQVATISLVVQKQVAMPTLSLASGTYIAAQSVSISTSESGATIRYTLDGTTPSATNGVTYSAAFSVATTATLKAIVTKSGANSAVATATYTIKKMVSTDVGTVALAGSTSLTGAGITVTVAASGADIYTAADQFRYSYVSASSSGSESISARVVSQTNTNVWAQGRSHVP
ncbi:hypothetical protein SAMD00019534_094540 [Acytostelium subglobosum LB1]|uniref:hypothetical protein n=1 Tax=Acytostelium subglobosum LB1 TaxID=1410327 RepID=UPI000644E1A9|nr:hypothetical protein SAMD00019534_094540 [Acytostelium subglobosum LB1]GAM26279.1 hypothetical protein SAMD00019534_094540 [Acytostelium subglobosum LB1]|eukprot:XP_012750833.1 hypothetical protein SAMD00019534_094540 [Acytostelium subglobosum LB1]